MKKLLTVFFVTALIPFHSGCSPGEARSNKKIAAENDPSGLDETALNTLLPETRDASKEELEKLKKGAAYYTAELKKKPVKPWVEWARLIDSLQPGMLEDQVDAKLPRASISTSNMWGYDGIAIGKVRQTKFWALDSEHAIAVVMDFSGDNAWNAAGKPKVRLRRHQNRLVSLPILVRHDNEFDDYGILKQGQFRFP